MDIHRCVSQGGPVWRAGQLFPQLFPDSRTKCGVGYGSFDAPLYLGRVSTAPRPVRKGVGPVGSLEPFGALTSRPGVGIRIVDCENPLFHTEQTLCSVKRTLDRN